MFDPAEYRIRKERCYERIKATHDWENTEGFIADGVICPEIYAAQSPRILCLLGESWGYVHCGMTPIEDQPHKDVFGLANPKAQTPRKLGAFLWLLQESLARGTALRREEFPRLFTITASNTALLQGVLSKIAWINVKKASRPNSTRMIDGEIREHARRNRAVLQEQIDSIRPDFMIVGSSAAFLALHELDLLPDGVECARVWQVQKGPSGPTVLEVTHPSYWWGYDKLYNNFAAVFSPILDAISAAGTDSYTANASPAQ